MNKVELVEEYEKRERAVRIAKANLDEITLEIRIRGGKIETDTTIIFD